MKKTIRILTLMLALLMCFTGVALTVFATAEIGEEIGGQTGEEIVTPGENDPVDDPGEIVSTPEYPGEEDPGDDTGIVSTPEVPDDNVVSEAEEPVYSVPEENITSEVETPVDDDPGYVAPEVDSYVEEDPGYIEPEYYDDDPIWYGNAGDYDYNTSDNNQSAGSVSDNNNSLYNNSNLSDSELAANKWDNITIDEKSVKTGSADFSAIQADTGSDDNGQWILLVGILLITLSLLGILYFIVATVNQKKNDKKQNRNGRPGPGSRSDYTSTRSGSDVYAAERAGYDRSKADRTAGERSTARRGHYSDGYNAPGRYTSRSSKADTAEIYIPKRFAKK